MNQPHPAILAIETRGLHARLDGVQVLHGIDLHLRNGCWTSVVGPNGAGKSTLLKALAQLTPHLGEVRLLGQDVRDLAPRQRARALAWLGQNEASGDDLTVWDVAMLGRLPHQAWLATPSEDDHRAVEQALRATQAWDWRERSLGHLSGGERQRVLLARALAVEADVMLMDEPLANLDPPHQAHWLSIVRTLAQAGKAVVSVLHEVAMALHADDIVVMDRGRVLHHGPGAAPQTHAALCAVFGHCFRIRQFDGQWIVLPVLAAQ